MTSLRMLHLPAVLWAAALLAGCGSGGGLPGVGTNPPTAVDAFAVVSAIVGGGGLDTAEPQDIDSLNLSTSETDEPDPRG